MNIEAFDLIVNNVNQNPIANDDVTSTAYETVKNNINVAANDSDVDDNLDVTSTVITQNPINGIASVDASGYIDYTPNNGFSGIETVKYTIKDLDGLVSNVANLTITVGAAPNQKPVANDDNSSTNEDVAKTLDVLANDVDTNLDVTSVSVIEAPAHGSTSVNAINGQITYTPALNNNDNVTFKYSVSDTEGLKDTATVNMVVNPVNDAVQSTGSIADKVVDKGNNVVIDLKPLFSDVETADENLTYLLSGLDLGTYSVANGIATIAATIAGTDINIRASASDGETSANSNYFTMTVNDIIETSNVTFKFRGASTDADLTSGTSTLRYKKSGDASYTTLTSTNGSFTVEMDKNIAYEIDGSHSGDLETAFGAPSVYLALKRTGDLEAFEQRAVDDESSPVTFTGTNETVYLYKLMSDFPLGPMQEYASKDENGNTGTRKFATSDKDAPIWWDKNYDNYTTEQRTWISEVCNDLKSLPHVYLTLPFQEGTVIPSSSYNGISMDASFPSPGTNSTTYNSNHEITSSSAEYPDSPAKSTFFIEILQAIGDLNDVGGNNPAILGNDYKLNTTGQKIFSVMYLFQPKTKF